MISKGMIKMMLEQTGMTDSILNDNAPMFIEEIDKEVFKDVVLNEDEEQPALLYVKKNGETFGMVITLPPNFFDAETSSIKVKRRIGLINIKNLISNIKIDNVINKFFN